MRGKPEHTIIAMTNLPVSKNMLTCNSQLNPQQLAALDELRIECKKIDGNIPAIYQHILSERRNLPCNMLYFEKEKLIGFLSLYFFYENACEITVLVAPTHRRQGIASKLIAGIFPVIKKQHINSLIFSTPLTVNEHWLANLGFRYQQSEYRLEQYCNTPIHFDEKSLILKEATINDLQALCAIDQACFPKQESEMASRFQSLLHDPNYSLLVAKNKEKIIGKAHLRWQQDSVILSDIAILPTMQQQGFGSALLAYCINKVINAGKHHLILDVETKNQQALNLYTRLGFAVSNACDYWEIETKKMCDFLN